MEETTLYIKNMVCGRCIQAVSTALCAEGLRPVGVELGVARVEGVPGGR